jgi:hypothetical protein
MPGKSSPRRPWYWHFRDSWRCGQAVARSAGAVIDGNRYWRRLLTLARWAFPDVWTAFAGSESTALAMLGRWPHLDVTEPLADLQESRSRVDRFTSHAANGMSISTAMTR